MKTFHHHPDGLVILQDGSLQYQDTLTNFAADCNTTKLKSYPGSAHDGEFYAPPNRHFAYANGTQHAGTVDRGLMDSYLNGISALVNAKSVRESSAGQTDTKHSDLLAAEQKEREQRAAADRRQVEQQQAEQKVAREADYKKRVADAARAKQAKG